MRLFTTKNSSWPIGGLKIGATGNTQPIGIRTADSGLCPKYSQPASRGGGRDLFAMGDPALSVQLPWATRMVTGEKNDREWCGSTLDPY
jgi:hypothetical protein